MALHACVDYLRATARNLVCLAIPLVIAACAGAPEAPPRDTPPAQTSAPEPATPQLDQAQRAAFQRGVRALEDNNGVVAVGVFKRLAESKPELAAAHANLGTAYMLRGEDAAAMAAYQQAVNLEPKLAVANLRLGVLYRRAGDYERAEAAYQAALSSAPDYPLVHLNLGVLYDVYMAQAARALIHYRRYQELSEQPDDEVALWIANLKQRLQP